MLSILHVLIVWQSLLFAAVLLTPKFRIRRSNIYLALLLLTIGVHFSYNILYTNDLFVSILITFSCSYGFLYGPLLWLYSRSYLYKDSKFKAIDWLHFLPFASVIVLTSIGYPICNILGVPLILVMLVYCILCYRVIVSYELDVVQVYSKSDPTQTRWIKAMLILMLVILVVNILQFMYSSLSVFGLVIRTETLVQIGILGLINLITYQGLKSPTSFQKISNQDMAITRTSLKPIDDDEQKVLDGYSKRIDEQVADQKLYLDPDLTIRQLAEETEIHEKSISKTINTIFDTNFSEYINNYRIQEAIRLIHSDENLSIKEVMFKSGFNSRSVFNTAFKQKTGATPSGYRNKS